MKENGLIKKLLGVVLLAGVLAFVWTATKPELDLVPLTECPLEEETVKSAVERVGLLWIVSEPETGGYTMWETEVDGVWCRMEWLMWPPRPYGSRTYELTVKFYESKDLCQRIDEREEQVRQEAQARREEREAAKAADNG